MYDRKLSAVLVLKYIVVNWDHFMIVFLKTFVIYGTWFVFIFLLLYGAWLPDNAKNTG